MKSVKLISLNIWTGQIHDGLIEFLEKGRDNTDIFCFQEITKSDKNVITHGTYSNMHDELVKLLPDFNHFFSPVGKGYDLKGPIDFPMEIGQATFVRKNLKIKDEGDVFVYRRRFDMGIPHPDGRADFPRNFIYTKIEKDGKEFLVLNIHGYWEPKPKYDTPQRFIQSQIILDFINIHSLPTILAGDFNLSIDTRALLIMEEKLRNLVKEYKLSTTRSNLYSPYYKSFDKFADYIFVSSSAEVKDFRALPDQVSDHLPLYLEFEV